MRLLRNMLWAPDAHAGIPPTPPAPTPEPTPAAPELPAEPPEDTGVNDFLMSNILASLRPDAEPAVEPAPEPPAEPPTPTPAPPATPATPEPTPTPAPAKPKKNVSIGKGHPAVEPPAPSIPQPPAPPAAPTPPAAPELALSADQQDELAEALVAERLFGNRYSGYAANLKQWYADFDRRAAALQAQKPGVTEEDDEYQALLASKPTIKTSDLKKVVKQMATEEAVQQTNKSLAPKLDELEMKSNRAENMPAITDFTQRVFPAGVRALIQNDDQSILNEPLKFAIANGIEAARAEYPEEVAIYEEVRDANKDRVKEFLLLKNRATSFDPKNQIHVEIANVIDQESNGLIAYSQKNGAHHLVREGRQFMPRGQFIAMLGSDRNEAASFDQRNWTTGRYWTFSDTTIVDIFTIRTKREAESRIAADRTQAEKRGYVKAPKKTVAQPQPEPPKPITPPKATPSAAPGAGRQAKPAVVDNSPIPVSTVASHLKITK